MKAKTDIKKQKKTFRKKTVKKIREKLPRAVLNIKTSFNNTIITLTRPNGETIGQASAGTIGYKGTKKSTPYAAQLAMGKVLQIASQYHIQEVDVKVRGIGAGRNSSLRSLESSNLKVLSISDVTPLPHNGCRPPKKPRS